ncbi:hypothetical protein A33Q_3923 [Indibacter alkaliphilus LW1]|uniref:Uncharacterized protein n=1 Tax=Indibacter alkaliphilus (strain CCUG 57479 / KCTC 22604 / LW1) TaxID=1189612 RepID=S2D0D4_INDAL|nr:hypothetical protein A33Q_3923 [Indibacter alkaliphilus LW1]
MSFYKIEVKKKIQQPSDLLYQYTPDGYLRNQKAYKLNQFFPNEKF